jgi:outer membrane protein OmpA-like peptidoglycan-associated protein
VKAPSISKIYDSAFRRSSGLWEKVKRNYVANGGEKFLTIGNFWNDTKIKKFHIEYEAVQESMLARACYYYIDDVSVVDLDSTQTLELIPFIDTKAVKTNEVYVLRNIQFEFNKSVLKTDSYPELTKLVTILSKNTGWKVLLTGHTDDVGTDEYNVQLSKNRAISVGDFLIKNGIEKARIVSNGMGKSEPLANTTDENARAANRRVEVIFLEEDEKK